MTKRTRSAVMVGVGIAAWAVGFTLVVLSADDIALRVLAIALTSVGIPLTMFGVRGLRSTRDD